MPDFTSLKVPNSLIGDSQLSDQLRGNICAFLDWGLLGLGGFTNVHLTDVLPYGGNPSTLRPSDDIRYTPGIVWDGYKTNWIWENNIEYPIQPIQISGIYINGEFSPNDGSMYNIAYPQGRVIFNSPISTASTVKVEYSWKLYNVYSDDVHWFKQLQQETWRLDDPQFNSQGSGIWSIIPESRAQLPAVVVESVPTRDFVGYQLGGGQWIHTHCFIHIMSNSESMRDNFLDILTYQNDKFFYFFDKNKIRASGAYPMNQYGYLVNPISNYPYLVNNYLWRYAIIREVTAQPLKNNAQSIHYGVAKMRIEIAFPEI